MFFMSPIEKKISGLTEEQKQICLIRMDKYDTGISFAINTADGAVIIDLKKYETDCSLYGIHGNVWT